jgi:hypothetical protein
MELRPNVDPILIQRVKNVKSEELLSRFRSKVDLYKYFTIQSKLQLRP